MKSGNVSASGSVSYCHFSWILGSCTFICVRERTPFQDILEKQNKAIKQRKEDVLGVEKCLIAQISTCYQVMSYVAVTHLFGVFTALSMEVLL